MAVKSRPARAPRVLLSVQEAMAYLGLSKRSIYIYIHDGRLPAYRIAGERLIRLDLADLDALLERIPTAGVR